MVELLPISDERRTTLLAALRKGSDRSEACQAAGIELADLEAWLARGMAEPPEEPFAAFAEDVEMFEAQVECEAQVIMHKLATGGHLEPREIELLRAPSGELDWRGLASWLEARYRRRVAGHI